MRPTSPFSIIIASLVATASFASDDHSSHSDHTAGEHAPMREGVHAEVTINSILDGVVNLSHGPIPEIGWPAMTMDLTLLSGADVIDVAEGDDAMMILEKGDDGIFAIRALMPVE